MGSSLLCNLLLFFCSFSGFFFLLVFFFFWYLIFVITMCLGVFLFGLIPFGTPCFLNVNIFSFHKSGKFSAIISSDTFSVSFSFSSLSWSLIIRMLVYLMLSQSFLKLFSFLFIFFGYRCSSSEISTTLSPSSLMHSSAPFNLLLIPSSVFLFQLFIISL